MIHSHFSDKARNTQEYTYYLNHKGATNDKDRSRMMKILYKAITTELTDMQRVCITKFYLEGEKQVQIANELGLNPSTVSRHISAAKKKLKRIAACYI